MVYYEGEYHLFFQYYPNNIVWGPMHWGHAVSKDLFHWKDLPIALYPDELGYVFSGSAVVDWNNSSGLGTKDTPPLVAIYTYHDAVAAEAGEIDYQTQGIAYSTDKGRTWVKYTDNPVLDNPGVIDFRDPKVFWHEETQKWVMALAVKDQIAFYGSPNLKEWSLLSEFRSEIGVYGGVWECPDLFPLEDEAGNTHWVLLVSINPGAPNGGSGTMYYVGDFDGEKFTNKNRRLHWLDYGRDNYAGVTWADIPEEDGRRIFMGWMSNWLYAQEVPTSPWRSAMTVARSLHLKKHGQDFLVCSKPVEEIQALRTASSSYPDHEGKLWTLTTDAVPFEIEFAVQSIDSSIGDFTLKLSNAAGESISMHYDPQREGLSINRDNAGNTAFNSAFTGEAFGPLEGAYETMNFRMIVDKTSLEVFVNEGVLAQTETFFPEEGPFTTLNFTTENTLNIETPTAHTLAPSMLR
jgi:fructan beta-fructosidase